jgi:stage III sporulation protein AG
MDLFKKYRFAILILLLGLGLMLIPAGKAGKEETPRVTQPQATAEMSVQLEEILSQIRGAGEVKVLLSVSAGEKIIYQSDMDISGGDNKTDTVIITDGNRMESGLVQQVMPKSYLGAIIVCRGADDPQVKLAIVEAVSRVTGLGADRISVLKMK